jgi:hypothetical protein
MMGWPELIIIVVIIIMTVVMIKRFFKRQPQSDPNHSVESNDRLGSSISDKYRHGVMGTVRHVEKREITKNKEAFDYLGFRLEIADPNGNVTEIIPVEMCAGSIAGRIIKDGDSVMVLGKRNSSGLMTAKSIFNLTTSAEIKAVNKFGFFKFILFMPLALLFLASFPTLFYGITRLFSTHSDQVGSGLLMTVLSIFVMTVFYYIYIKR